MSNPYAAFRREPSKPHQCMHDSEEDGTRCRAIAMHGEMMCYQHRPDVILPVIENEPFLLENLDTRADIQRALGQVARQLACNRMDFERAHLLVQIFTAAMRNLPPHPRPARTLPTPAQPAVILCEEPTQNEDAVILSEQPRDESKDPDALSPSSAIRTIPSPNPTCESPATEPATLPTLQAVATPNVFTRSGENGTKCPLASAHCGAAPGAGAAGAD